MLHIDTFVVFPIIFKKMETKNIKVKYGPDGGHGRIGHGLVGGHDRTGGQFHLNRLDESIQYAAHFCTKFYVGRTTSAQVLKFFGFKIWIFFWKSKLWEVKVS